MYIKWYMAYQRTNLKNAQGKREQPMELGQYVIFYYCLGKNNRD